MIVGISGTPGTGKTTIAKIVAKKLNYKLIEMNEIVRDERIYTDYDEFRNSYIVDMEKLNKIIKRKVGKKKNVIIESHLSHFLDFLDLLIILRTNPEELRKRLENRNWSKTKILENVHSEIIDVILQESVGRHENIYEIDTSRKDFRGIADEVIKIIKNPEVRKNYLPGRFDWTGYLSYF